MSTHQMWPETQREAINRLTTDYGFKQSPDRQWLRQGRCPACDKKEFYTRVNDPWLIRCGRLNHCGYEVGIRDLYPDLFTNWSKRYPQTSTNPHAAADAYLSQGRGLDHTKLIGCYTQESYFNPAKGHSATTIRFPIADGWWERLLDPKGDMPKSVVKKGWAISGHWWVPPNTPLSRAPEIWITEGIFDAVALWMSGLTTVSAMSSIFYPEYGLSALAQECDQQKVKRPTLIWAFDTGKSGEDFTEKFVERATKAGWKCKAAQPPLSDRKEDWNDLYKTNRLTPKDLERYRYYGDLLLAPSAKAKALLMHEYTDQTSFSFRFHNRLFWSKLDVEKYYEALNKLPDTPDHLVDDESKKADAKREKDVMASCINVQQIANCYPEPLYYQYNEDMDESWYYFRINFPKGNPIKNTFTGSQLSVASEFKKRLLAIAPGVIFKGSSSQLDQFLLHSIENIKRVETIDYVGYSNKHNAYIFNQLAFQRGRVYQLNHDDYFEMPRNTNIKSLLAKSLKININPTPSEQTEDSEGSKDWVQDLMLAWGVKGLLGLAGFVGSLFAEQIRAKHKSYHFLELTGEPGAGKSTLISFMWRLLGRDGHEGTDPHKGSGAGLRRSLSQISNLPIVLMESDRESNGKASQFDWNALKNLFDGGSLGARGIKNNSNDIIEPMYKGTIVISQNAEVVSSEAIMSRICQIFFYTADQTRLSEAAARRIEQTSSEQVSHFAYKLLCAESKFLEIYLQKKAFYEERLKDSGIKTFRVAFCHGQLMALFDALAHTVLPQLMPHIDLAFGTIINMAKARDEVMRADAQIVMQFWEVYEQIEACAHKVVTDYEVNHSKDPNIVAINFAQFYQTAKQQLLDLPPIGDMQNALRHSRLYKFKAANVSIHSCIDKKSKRCWLFEKPKDPAQGKSS